MYITFDLSLPQQQTSSMKRRTSLGINMFLFKSTNRIQSLCGAPLKLLKGATFLQTCKGNLSDNYGQI